MCKLFITVDGWSGCIGSLDLFFSLQVGEYSFDRHNGRILVIYTAVDGEYRLTFSLKHGELRGCSEPYPANESKALEVK